METFAMNFHPQRGNLKTKIIFVDCCTSTDEEAYSFDLED